MLQEEALEMATYKLGQGSNNLTSECSTSREIFLPLTRFYGGRYQFVCGKIAALLSKSGFACDYKGCPLQGEVGETQRTRNKGQ